MTSETVCDDGTTVLTLVYSTDAGWMQQAEEAGAPYLFACEQLIGELDRICSIEEKSLLHSPAGRQPAVSASAYLAERESDGGMSIMAQLDGMEAAMAEGCLGDLAEIYDGGVPGASKGCFAQAWSVAELLRVYQEVEAILE